MTRCHYNAQICAIQFETGRFQSCRVKISIKTLLSIMPCLFDVDGGRVSGFYVVLVIVLDYTTPTCVYEYECDTFADVAFIIYKASGGL